MHPHPAADIDEFVDPYYDRLWNSIRGTFYCTLIGICIVIAGFTGTIIYLQLPDATGRTVVCILVAVTGGSLTCCFYKRFMLLFYNEEVSPVPAVAEHSPPPPPAFIEMEDMQSSPINLPDPGEGPSWRYSSTPRPQLNALSFRFPKQKPEATAERLLVATPSLHECDNPAFSPDGDSCPNSTKEKSLSTEDSSLSSLDSPLPSESPSHDGLFNLSISRTSAEHLNCIQKSVENQLEDADYYVVSNDRGKKCASHVEDKYWNCGPNLALMGL